MEKSKWWYKAHDKAANSLKEKYKSSQLDWQEINKYRVVEMYTVESDSREMPFSVVVIITKNGKDAGLFIYEAFISSAEVVG